MLTEQETRSELEKEIYIKELRLVSPERAQELGLSAEGPVFISPGINESKICSVCGVEYTPLVYQKGYVISSHHFHSEKDPIKNEEAGGIYHWGTKGLNGPTHSSWRAILRPIGQSVRQPLLTEQTRNVHPIYRSESVYVAQILAFCNPDGHGCPYKRLTDKFPFGEQLSEGIAVLGSNDWQGEFLFPLCEDTVNYDRYFGWKSNAKMRFLITEGEVLFSQF